MMVRRILRIWLVAAVVALGLVGASVVRADVTITMENEVTSPQGTQTTTVTQYYTPTKMRSEFGQASVSIMDVENGKVITLLPALKQYIVVTFEQLKEKAAAVKMAKPEIAVEETEETETISGYECQKFLVHVKMAGKETVTEQWMTAEAKGVEAVFEFQKKMGEAFKDMPQASVDQQIREQFANEGRFPIRTVVRFQRPDGEMTSTMTVTKIEKGDLDDKLFEIPKDYTEQTFDTPAGAGQSKSE